jgi:hypothetical protein
LDTNGGALLRIDEKLGHIYLNSADNHQDTRQVELKICAILRSSQVKGSILIESRLLIKIEPKVDESKPLLRVFTEQSSTNSPISLTIPLKLFVSSSSLHSQKYLKIFKFFNPMTSNLSLVTSSADLFGIDSSNGWIMLRRGELEFRSQTHHLRVYSRRRRFNEVETSSVDLIVRIVESWHKDTEVDLHVPFHTETGMKLIDLKRFLSSESDEFKYMVLSETTPTSMTCDECVYYSQADGFLYLSKIIELDQLNREFRFELKLTSKNGDLRFLVVNLKFYKDEMVYAKMTGEKKLEIYVSAQSAIGSVIYDSSSAAVQIKGLASTYGSFFTEIGGKVIVAKNLTHLLDETNNPVEIDLLTADSTLAPINLRLYLIEKLKNSLKFARINYYFNYKLKLTDTKRSVKLGVLTLDHNGSTNKANTIEAMIKIVKTRSLLILFHLIGIHN